MAMAVYGMGVVLAPAIGPILGGWLTDHYGWPWIFFINVPVSVVGMLLVTAFVQDPPYLRRGVKRIDWPGIALLAVGLTTLQVVLERGKQENWFQSHWILLGTAVTVLALGALVALGAARRTSRRERPAAPNVPLAVGSSHRACLRHRAVRHDLHPAAVHPGRCSATRRYQAGLVLVPRALTLFVAMPLAGLALQLRRRAPARVGRALPAGPHLLAACPCRLRAPWNMVPCCC